MVRRNTETSNKGQIVTVKPPGESVGQVCCVRTIVLPTCSLTSPFLPSMTRAGRWFVYLLFSLFFGGRSFEFGSQNDALTMLNLHLHRVVIPSTRSFGTRRPLQGFVSLSFSYLSNPSTSKRYPSRPTCSSVQGSRFFVTSTGTRAPASASSPPSPTSTSTPHSTPARRSILSRFLPATFTHNADGTIPTSTAFRKIVALARPERRPLLTAIGLLLVSSTVSLSIPFTVGKLIDYFTSASPVRRLPYPPVLGVSIYNSSFLYSYRRSRMASH